MNRNRRAVLRGVVALAGLAFGAAGATGSRAATQEVDTSLPPGAVLFDLDGDGAYDATVERAPESMRDDGRPTPIRITSGGRATVDYAASVVEPEGHPALGDLDRLSYDYYVGPDDRAGGDGGGETADSDGGEGGGDDGAPDETFLVVENDDGRHGVYLTYHDGRAAEQWRTHDALARVTGDTAGTSGWFEYTGDDGGTFDDAVGRFGADARLVRVGVGRGDGVAPTTLDAAYGGLVVNDRRYRFPVEVARRSSGPPSRGALGERK